jgi:hypothetical protein
LIVKNDGNATSVLGTSGITVAMDLPDALFEALRQPLNAASENPPIVEQTGIEIHPFSNRPGYNPARCATSHGLSTESGCFNAGELAASNGRGCSATPNTLDYWNEIVVIPCEYNNALADLRANPSRTRIRHAFDANRVNRTNSFLASVVLRNFDWLPAAQVANNYRADWLWRVLPGRQPADLITMWLSTGLLPDDACQKINERIARALKANSERRISLDNLVRDIDALTDALTKLFEEAQGDLDAVYVAISEAIKDSADRHAYRLRRSKGEKAGEVDLPDVAMLPPSQFVSDLFEKLHRQIDKITQQPFGTSLNEATARLGRIAFTKPVATRSQQL